MINTRLVLVFLSVYTFEVSNTTFEDKDQTFGDKACHPERSEGSRRPGNQILRFAQDDSQDSSSGRSQQGFSPNV